jgi:hypothetical protein
MLVWVDNSSPTSTTFIILLMAQLVLPCTTKSTTLHISGACIHSCQHQVCNVCHLARCFFFSNACRLIICVLCSCCVDVCVMMFSSDDRYLVRAQGRPQLSPHQHCISRQRMNVEALSACLAVLLWKLPRRLLSMLDSNSPNM